MIKMHVFNDDTASAVCNKTKQNVPFAFHFESKLYDEQGYEVKDYNKVCFACLSKTMPGELNKLRIKKANELIKRRDKIRLNKLNSIVKATMTNAKAFKAKQKDETIKRNAMKVKAKRKRIKAKRLHVFHGGKVICGIKFNKSLNVISKNDKGFDINKIDTKQVCKNCLNVMKRHLAKQSIKKSNFQKVKQETIKRETKQNEPVNETKQPSNDTIKPDKPMGIEINGELIYRIVNNGFDGFKVVYRNKTNNTISDITHNWISYKKAFQVLLSQVDESQKANLVNC